MSDPRSTTPERRIFVAGATGVTGRALLEAAAARKVRVLAHARPSSVAKLGPAGAAHEVVTVDLGDAAGLTAALAGVTTIVQCIGTMKKRFAAGDTYETSDIGTTQQLVDAGRAAGVDHIVLLGSVGAGGVGAYLKAKARAEEIVRGSGMAWTIFRPSVLIGEDRGGVPGFGAVTRLLGLKKYQPIKVEQLAGALLLCARERAPLGVALEGKPLWELVARGLG